MTDYAKLSFNGNIVGYRAQHNGQLYDAEASTLDNLGIPTGEITKTITLKNHNGLLVSSSELKTGKYATDITNNISALREVYVQLILQAEQEKVQTQKPAPPKIVTKKDLQFSKGLAIILLGIGGEHGEYNTASKNYDLYLVFKTKTAINKASSILGFRLDKKRTLQSYERGQKAFQVRVEGAQYSLLTSEFSAPIGVTKEGFIFIDTNHHSGSRINTTIKPPNFKIDPEYQDSYYGATAYSGSFSEYMNNLIKSFAEGSYVYYPNLTQRDISRL